MRKHTAISGHLLARAKQTNLTTDPSWPFGRFTRVVLPQRFYLGNLNEVVNPDRNAANIQTRLWLAVAPRAPRTRDRARVIARFVGNMWGRMLSTHTVVSYSCVSQRPHHLGFFSVYQLCAFRCYRPTDSTHIPFTLGIGAALIDQYDADDQLRLPESTMAHPAPAPPPATPQYNRLPGVWSGANWVNCAVSASNVHSTAPPPPDLTPHLAPSTSTGPPAAWGSLVGPTASLTPLTIATPAPPPKYLIDFKDAYNSATNPDPALLDFFTYNSAPVRSGIVSLNTRQPPVLAAILKTAILRPSRFSMRSQALTAANSIVNATTAQPAMSRADIPRLRSAAPDLSSLSATIPTAKTSRDTFARALSEVTQTRTWGLLIDVVAQTGHYKPNATSLQTDFVVEGEKRYWLHVAIDRFDGTIVGQQLEEVTE